MDPTTKEGRAALRAFMAAATQNIVANAQHDGPTVWRLESDAPGYPNDGWCVADLHGPDGSANAEAIPAALQALPAALDEIDRLAAENERLREALEEIAAIRTEPIDPLNSQETALAAVQKIATWRRVRALAALGREGGET